MNQQHSLDPPFSSPITKNRILRKKNLPAMMTFSYGKWDIQCGRCRLLKSSVQTYYRSAVFSTAKANIMAGKKSKTPSAQSSSSSAKTIKIDGDEVSLEESLERARIALDKNQHHMFGLHRAWRSQLQRISIMVLMVVLKQSSIPATDCLEEIKTWNEQITSKNNAGEETVGDESLLIGGWEAGKYCVADSFTEIFSALCCLSLIWLIYQPLGGDDFTTLPFRISTSFVPMILSSFYNKPIMGCLADLAGNGDREGSVEKHRSFPVVLIFMVVTFASLSIMRYQQTQQVENIEKIEKLRKDLVGSKKKN
eukprot:jgi/Psemu1/323883/estExt_fgenesh1_pg.C_1010042